MTTRAGRGHVNGMLWDARTFVNNFLCVVTSDVVVSLGGKASRSHCINIWYTNAIFFFCWTHCGVKCCLCGYCTIILCVCLFRFAIVVKSIACGGCWLVRVIENPFLAGMLLVGRCTIHNVGVCIVVGLEGGCVHGPVVRKPRWIKR